jgi:aminoglycoside 3-N-acetyltransferase
MYFTKKDIVLKLKKSGIKKGDIVFFNTSLGTVGIPKKIKHNKKDLCELFFEAFKEVTGEKGTILIPSYSYTFKSNSLKIFDHKKTKPQIGMFPDFFFKQKNVIRSLDPIVSVSGYGLYAKKILNFNYTSSYGKNSIFSMLYKFKNVKCCSIGLDIGWLPFIHHLDYLSGAPFRNKKTFRGYFLKNEKKIIKNWEYHVRDLRPETYVDGVKMGKVAFKNRIIKRKKIGYSYIYTSNYKKYFDFILKILKKDPWFSIVGPKY